jgi:hypothetical protein
MRVVYSYPVQTGNFTLELPAGAEVLRASFVPASHEVVMWVAVNTDASSEERRRFILVRNGDPIGPAKDLRYIDTIFMNAVGIVMHLFEILQVEDL